MDYISPFAFSFIIGSSVYLYKRRENFKKKIKNTILNVIPGVSLLSSIGKKLTNINNK